MDDERFYVALSEKGYPSPFIMASQESTSFQIGALATPTRDQVPLAPPQARLETLPTLYANAGLLTAPQLGWSLPTPGPLKGKSHLLSGVSMKL